MALIMKSSIAESFLPSYYSCQKDPWDWQLSLLCNEIGIILKSVGMDFKVNAKGPIYKNVSTFIFSQLLSSLIQLPGHSVSCRQLVSSHWLCVPDTHHRVYLWKPEVRDQ